ncbi:hypothetical protein QN277_023018 [Acacia crassicarpa]|nr:hypothetical protein QN277_023018 [Acacia crassicarpa]
MPSSSSSTTQFNKLGKKWMEYQGLSDWDSLLDPLDDNLRFEILRYGNFVEAAYKSFNSEASSSPSYAATAACSFPKNKLSDCCGYKLTKNLHATSGIELPRWVEKAPSWVATRSSNIGYIAVCDNE